MRIRSIQHGTNTSSAEPMLADSVVMSPVRSRAVGRLEPCAGKLACTVLRGEHAGNGVLLPDGKARKPYEFGVKVSLAVAHKSGLIIGARSFPGNPFDGHTLAAQLEQTGVLLQDIGVTPKVAVVDLGYRGVDKEIAPVELIHRGKYKSLSNEQKRWLKRRQAIEPTIGHTKHDHRMDKCWLKGAEGDALHAVLCAAGFNIRWLMRALRRRLQAGGLKHVFLASIALWTTWLVGAMAMLIGTIGTGTTPRPQLASQRR